MFRVTSLLTAIVFVSACVEWQPPRDGLTEHDAALIASMRLTGRPTDPSNKFVENDDVALFGAQLFFDRGLSAPLTRLVTEDGGVFSVGDASVFFPDAGVIVSGDWQQPVEGISCADCHSPRAAFSDERRPGNVSRGLDWTKRNSPSLLNVATYAWYGWDGRAGTLWTQSLHAYESKATMAGSPLRLLRAVYLRTKDGSPVYRSRYRELFGVELPAELDPTHPDHAVFETGVRVRELNDHYERLLKAWAAYQTRLVSIDSPFDRYAGGDDTALSTLQKQGLSLFIGKAGCIECHRTATFSDDQFHSVGIGQSGPNVASFDLGRVEGITALRNLTLVPDGGVDRSQFVGPTVIPTAVAGDVGLFRTKGLRNISLSAPYMHAGQLQSLRDVVWFYNVGGDREGAGTPSRMLVPLGLTEDEQTAIVSFLESLTGTSPETRWLCDTSVETLPRMKRLFPCEAKP